MNPLRVAVVGPESTGTKLTVRIVSAAGAEALHRSFPYGNLAVGDERRWPEAEVREFDPQALVGCTRDWWAVAASQVAAGYVADTDEALSNIRAAGLRIATLAEELQVPYLQVSYESLVQRPLVVIQNLCGGLGLVPPEPFETIVDGNAKYLDRPRGVRR